MEENNKKDYILASQSPQRQSLLSQIGYNPKTIFPANIDESVLDKENNIVCALTYYVMYWSGREDSNLRLHAPHACALPG